MDALPLTRTGKLDRQVLPPPSRDRPDSDSTIVPARSELERKLLQIWEKALDVRPIGVQDNFFDLGGHSLLAVQLFAQINEALGLRLSVSTLFQAHTVEQLAKVISQEGATPPSSSLVPIKPEGSLPPFYLVHSQDGEVLFYHDLASHLGREQPVYGLQALLDDDGLPRHQRVEEMAAHYVEVMLTFQPQGPYYLGGYCFGARVAFEMGRQLQAMGREVVFLALIDTYAPGDFRPQSDMPIVLQQICKFWDMARRFSSIVRYISWLDRGKRLSYVAKMAKFHLRALLRSLYTYRGRPLPGFLRPDPVGERGNLSDHLRDYQPKVYPGRATLFRPSQQPLGIPRLPHMGWGELVDGDLEIEEVPGYHHTLIYRPKVRPLAERVQRHLHNAQVRWGEAQRVGLD